MNKTPPKLNLSEPKGPKLRDENMAKKFRIVNY